MAKLIQLAIRIFCCLSSTERLARDAGGLAETLKVRNFTVTQNDDMQPTRHTITGKPTVIVFCPLLYTGTATLPTISRST
jgi:hypothetical protein